MLPNWHYLSSWALSLRLAVLIMFAYHTLVEDQAVVPAIYLPSIAMLADASLCYTFDKMVDVRKVPINQESTTAPAVSLRPGTS